jgi:hypothetical protein
MAGFKMRVTKSKLQQVHKATLIFKYAETPLEFYVGLDFFITDGATAFP